MKMRAAILETPGAVPPYASSRPLRIGEVELAPPAEGEVQIKIAAAGLCHSDLSVIDGSRPRPLPMVLGHEAAGVVTALGRGVTDLSVGDHVILVFVPSCGHCSPCAGGQPALCEPGAAANGTGELLGGGRRLSRDGEALNHHLGVSAFAEYATVSRRSVIRIDRDIPLAHAALFGCAVLTGVGAVVNTAQISAGSSVAVLGLGGVGLAALIGAVAAGASRVVAIDLQDDKLRLAKSFGATDTYRADAPEVVPAIVEATRGGVDIAVELAGSVKALDLAYRITRRGGTTVTGGLPHPDAVFPVPAAHLVAQERTLKGSYIGSAIPTRDVPRYIELFRRGRMPVDRLLTHTLRLDDINEGFDRLHKGEAVRQVIIFD